MNERPFFVEAVDSKVPIMSLFDATDCSVNLLLILLLKIRPHFY